MDKIEQRISVDPQRCQHVMLDDGEFLCAHCVAENAELINMEARNPCPGDGWAVVGYCGDKLRCEETGRELTVNHPEPESRCGNCNKVF